MKTLWLILGGFYYGGSISAFTNYGLESWQWWAMVVPTAFFVTMYGNEAKREEDGANKI